MAEPESGDTATERRSERKERSQQHAV